MHLNPRGDVMSDTPDPLVLYVLKLPDAKNSQTVLTKIARALQCNNMPPGVGNVKGFMRHVTDVKVEDHQLVLTASVPYNALTPTILNLGQILRGGAVLAMLETMFSDPDPVTVISMVTIEDFRTRRFTYCSITSFPDDAKGAAKTGKVIEPLMLAAFVENTDKADLKNIEDTIIPWETGVGALLQATATYLESGHATTMH